MKDKAFFDTNVLLYLYSEDEHEKKAACTNALKEYDCITSTQAINELCNVFTKKWKLSVDNIRNAVQEIETACNVQIVNMPVINLALTIHHKYSYSYYDCLMLSAAILNGCKYILSEDMQDGQVIEGLKIVNILSKISSPA